MIACETADVTDASDSKGPSRSAATAPKVLHLQPQLPGASDEPGRFLWSCLVNGYTVDSRFSTFHSLQDCRVNPFEIPDGSSRFEFGGKLGVRFGLTRWLVSILLTNRGN